MKSKEKKLELKDSTIYQTNENCQVFNGPISGCVFAMPGATVNQSPVQEIKTQQTEGENEEIPFRTDEEIARAIENCQEYFWGNSAYAVVFCIFRDELKRKMTKTDFETMIEKLPYKKKRSYACPAGTIANALSDNPVFLEHIDEWNEFNPLPRIMKLRNQLRKELNL